MDVYPLLLATGNRHKVEEMGPILAGLLPGMRLDLLFAGGDFRYIDEPEENGTSFEENALLKARYYARQTGLLTLADDSGLVIDALDGRPGIYSARYAPTAAGRIARALAELEGVPAERRSARFVCVAALCDPHGGEAYCRGTVEGRITPQPAGQGGFGYDPIFAVDDPGAEAAIQGLTLAEIAPEQKNSLSHRGRALAALAPVLAAALSAGGRVAPEGRP